MSVADQKEDAVRALKSMSVRALRLTETTWKERGHEIKIDGRPAVFWAVEQAVASRKQDDRERTRALAVLSWLLKTGVSTEIPHKGNTSLMEAAAEGDVACARRLIAAGASLTAKSAMGNTPLHWAAIGGRPAMCKLLVVSGADMSLKNQERQTPLHCAADRLRMNTIAVLHEAGSDWDCKDAHGRTPLDIIDRRDPSHAKAWKNRPERDRLARDTAASAASSTTKSPRSRRL